MQVRLNILRDYLAIELRAPAALPFPSSLEHVIDDFIVLSALCGNDFLPAVPSLLIREGAIQSTCSPPSFRALTPSLFLSLSLSLLAIHVQVCPQGRWTF